MPCIRPDISQGPYNAFFLVTPWPSPPTAARKETEQGITTVQIRAKRGHLGLEPKGYINRHQTSSVASLALGSIDMNSVDLTHSSSLPLKLDERRLRLLLGGDLRSSKPVPRTSDEMREVLLAPDEKAPKILYWMYRDLHFARDEAVLRSHNLRFDATVIRGGLIGREFIKTAGHYHPVMPAYGLSYPEIYEVIHGEAVYLLQKVRALADPRRVVDVVQVQARTGDRVIIPPDYGHVTINPYKTTLVMTNVTADGFQSEYEPYRRLGGAVYHLVSEGGRPEWLPNKRYINPPPVRTVPVKEFPQLGLVRGRAMYEALLQNPEAFEFLTKPHRHLGLLNSVLR